MLNLKNNPQAQSEKVYAFGICFALAVTAFIFRISAMDNEGFINGTWFVTVCVAMVPILAVKNVVNLFRFKFSLWGLIKTLFLGALTLLVFGVGFSFTVQSILESSSWTLGGNYSIFFVVSPALQLLAVWAFLQFFKVEMGSFKEEVQQKILKGFRLIARVEILYIAFFSYMEDIVNPVTGGQILGFFTYPIILAPFALLGYLAFSVYKLEIKGKEEDAEPKAKEEPSLEEEGDAEAKKPFYIRAYTRGLKGFYNLLEKVKPKV